jgi:hypothetical protein
MGICGRLYGRLNPASYSLCNRAKRVTALTVRKRLLAYLLEGESREKNIKLLRNTYTYSNSFPVRVSSIMSKGKKKMLISAGLNGIEIFRKS